MPRPGMESEFLLTGAAGVATCDGPPRATSDTDPAGFIPGAAIHVRYGRIAEIDEDSALRSKTPGVEAIDCSGGVLTPGLVDSHTHAVFGRWRADEYALRCAGVDYMEIAARGGGINASVRDLRSRSDEKLEELTLDRIDRMLRSGTTTVEVKSGYGLTVEDELRMLRIIAKVAAARPVTIVPTFLGAHAVPPEFSGRADDYVDLVVNEMIPAVAAENLAVFCDVFMEPGVFDGAQAERVLRAGFEHGLVPKLHADELEHSGGAELAAELGAASADHLGAINDAGIAALAASGTVATILPTTLFFLGHTRYAPARQLLDAGAELAIATDFNPGTSPTSNLQFAMTAAASQCGILPSEALRAATAGGAAALRLSDGTGRITVGGPADLVLWEAPNVDAIPYRLASDIVRGVWKRGVRIL